MTQWAGIMSKGTKYLQQVIEMDFQYPSEGIHYNWDKGACTPVRPFFMLAVPACAHSASSFVFVEQRSIRRPPWKQ